MSTRTGAIAAGHPLTVAAGVTMLQRGGNAFDAAIAALAVSFIAEPLLTSPGGGGFLLAAPAGAEPCLYDFFAQTPLVGPDLSAEFYPVGVDFGPTTQEFHIGRGAIAVLGVLCGLVTVADCQVYRVEPRSPLRFGCGAWEVLTNPPPSGGGVLIGISLDQLQGQAATMADLVRALIRTEAVRPQLLNGGEPLTSSPG